MDRFRRLIGVNKDLSTIYSPHYPILYPRQILISVLHFTHDFVLTFDFSWISKLLNCWELSGRAIALHVSWADTIIKQNKERRRSLNFRNFWSLNIRNVQSAFTISSWFWSTYRLPLKISCGEFGPEQVSAGKLIWNTDRIGKKILPRAVIFLAQDIFRKSFIQVDANYGKFLLIFYSKGKVG